MVHVNEKLGFRRTYVEVRLVKRLGGPGSVVRRS